MTLEKAYESPERLIIVQRHVSLSPLEIGQGKSLLNTLAV